MSPMRECNPTQPEDLRASLRRMRIDEVETQRAEEAKWHHRSWWIGTARLLVFIAFTILGIETVRGSTALLWRGMLPAAAGFIALVGMHSRVRGRRVRAWRRHTLATESLARMQGVHGPGAEARLPLAPCSALDAGHAALLREGAAEELDAWAVKDLGIDDESPSLFTLLNTTQSSLGARRLRWMVRAPLLQPSAIRARQAAVDELAAALPRRDAFMLAACGGRSLRLERLPAFLARAAELPGGWMRPALATCGLLVPLLLALGFVVPIAWPAAGLAFILLFVMSLPIRQRVGPVRETWLEMEPLLRVIQEVARSLLTCEPTSVVLQAQRRAFATATAAHACVPAALRLTRLLHLRGMGFLYGVIELLTSWELHWLLALEARWRREPRALEQIVEAYCDLEALLALAVFRAEHPEWCVPDVLEAPQPRLEIEAGAHPLLAQAVSNDVRLGGDRRVAVVTGSNMAGKSTYLRMVALHCVAAQIGAPVRAASMRFTPLRLVANINVHDSLADGKSYFLVEVERVQRILALAERETHVLGLFDELFRGTNSTERLAASLEVTRWLAARGGLFLLATHEQEVAGLAGAADAPGIVALHFGEEIDGDRLVFPYRVQEGLTTAHNALRWLERCGYPRELVERARERARRTGAAD